MVDQASTTTAGKPAEASAAERAAPQPLLDVRDLRVAFPRRAGRDRSEQIAVDGVSLSVMPGQTLGLVGESGCGKTTVGRAVLRLLPPHPAARQEGEITINGRRWDTMSAAALRPLRRDAQIVFQDPGGSLSPRMRVGEIVGEPLLVHGLCTERAALRSEVAGLLDRCGMPADAAERYPHEFSGGQKQRIAIARALALQPRLIICDEPTSALDVSVQAQILNLLKDLQREKGLGYLFISHDMAVVDHMCDRVAVMRAGRIVEEGTRDEVIDRPREQYTRALLAAVPRLK